ncbi:MAG: hypothetical protein JO100_05490 [Pseudonocardia sp.]|nr:hypothetical protein [Pseudonocardia sp.]
MLLLFGDEDKLFPPPADKIQKDQYLLNSDVILEILPNTAHGILYEATHLLTVEITDRWLDKHEGHSAGSMSGTPGL